MLKISPVSRILVSAVLAWSPSACGGGGGSQSRAGAGGADDAVGAAGLENTPGSLEPGTTDSAAGAGGSGADHPSASGAGASSVTVRAVTSVSGRTLLSSLTAKEKKAVCSEGAEYLSSTMLPVMCTVMGVLSTSEGEDSEAECQSYYEQCIAEGLDTSRCTATETDDCEATVEELSRCYEDLGAAYEKIEVSCKDANAALVAYGSLRVPARCEALTADCPSSLPQTSAD
jgi:hypothetical protein